MSSDDPMVKLTSVLDTEDIPDGMVLRVFGMPGGAYPQTPVELSHWTLEVGSDSGDDRHEVPEMWLIAAGRGEMTCDGRTMGVAAGDVVAIGSGRPHRLLNTGDVPISVFSVWWSQ